jgi:hypothetical protein
VPQVLAFWTISGAVGFLKKALQQHKKKESCLSLGLVAGYDKPNNEPSVSRMAPELLSGRATISLRVSGLS